MKKIIKHVLHFDIVLQINSKTVSHAYLVKYYRLYTSTNHTFPHEINTSPPISLTTITYTPRNKYFPSTLNNTVQGHRSRNNKIVKSHT
jgi:hypothetical protein